LKYKLSLIAMDESLYEGNPVNNNTNNLATPTRDSITNNTAPTNNISDNRNNNIENENALYLQENASVTFDTEQIYFYIHFHFVQWLSRLFSSRLWLLIEIASMLNAILLLVLLLSLHWNFVGKGNCVSKLLEHEAINMNNETFLLKVEVDTSLGKLLKEYRGHSHKIYNTQKNHIQEAPQILKEQQNIDPFPLENSVFRFLFGENYRGKFFWKQLRSTVKEADIAIVDGLSRILYDADLDSLLLSQLNPTYLFSIEKGLLYLSDSTKQKLSIKQYNITLSFDDVCIGSETMRSMLENLLGYETFLLNDFYSLFNGGYLYSFQTGEICNLLYGNKFNWKNYSLHEWIFMKLFIGFTAILVYGMVTLLVSYTVREIQRKSIQLHVDIRRLYNGIVGIHGAGARIPSISDFWRIFANYVAQASIFSVVIVGVLLLVSDLSDDGTMIVMLLFLVYCTELFGLISARTQFTIYFFPRFVFLYIMLYLLYFFSYPFGFGYFAFIVLIAFVQHLMLFFFVRYEIPAVLYGHIHESHPREPVSTTFPRNVIIRAQTLVFLHQESQQSPSNQSEDQSLSTTSSSSSSLSREQQAQDEELQQQ